MTDSLGESLRATIEDQRRALQQRLDSLKCSQQALRQTLGTLRSGNGHRLWLSGSRGPQPRSNDGIPAAPSYQQRDDERRRIARELHDELGQSLVVLSIGLKAAEDLCGGNDALVQQLSVLQKLVAEMHIAVRELTTRLRPAALEGGDVHKAISELVASWTAHTSVEVDVEFGPLETEPSPAAQDALYRFVQEALTNVARHARARQVSVVIQQRGEQLLALVEDNGVGCEVQPGNGAGHGFKGILERLEPLGGSLEMESSPGQGTTLYVRIPLTAREENRNE